MEEPYKYTPKTQEEKKRGFLERMKRGFGRIKEIKEKIDESRLQSAEKRIERQGRYAQVYEAEARMYGAAARKEKARQQFSQIRMGGFGGGQQKPFPIDMGFGQSQQPVSTKVVYRTAPKRKSRTRRRVRYVQAPPQPSLDNQLVAFMRR